MIPTMLEAASAATDTGRTPGSIPSNSHGNVTVSRLAADRSGPAATRSTPPQLDDAVSAAAPAIPPVALELPKISTSAAMRLGKRQARADLITSLPLLALDVAGAAFASVLAHAAAGFSGQPLTATFIGGVVFMTVLFQQIHGLYPACGLTYSIEFRRIVRTCLMVTIGVGFGFAIHPAGQFNWPALLVLAPALTLVLSALRPIGRHLLASQSWWTQPIVIIGGGVKAERLFHRLSGCRCEGLRPLGIVTDHDLLSSYPTDSRVPECDADWYARLRQLGELPFLTNPTAGVQPERLLSRDRPVLGSLADLETVLTTHGVCRVAVADDDPRRFQNFHAFHGIPHVMLPTELGHRPTERIRLAENDGEIELHCHTALTKPHALIAKRTMDLAVTLAAMPIWLPLMMVIAVWIKITDPGPVFYRQSRVGRYRTPFSAIKFRSMVINADARLRHYLDAHPELQSEWDSSHKLKCDPRITKIGTFLRKTSLDELPQLWNVLVGEMSLVGPRPIIDCSDYDREYIQEHPEVFELYQMVRPGITGMWQVSGRNGTSYIQRVYYDRFYLNNWCLELDCFILWRTVKTALFREGAC